MLPWWLYGLTPRDQSQPVMRIWNQADTVIGATATVQVEYQVPDEQVAVLANWTASMQTAGAFSPVLAELVIDRQGIEYRSTSQVYPDTVNRAIAFIPLPFVLAPPRSIVRISGSWGGAQAGNTLFVGLAAILMPKGTLQVV